LLQMVRRQRRSTRGKEEKGKKKRNPALLTTREERIRGDSPCQDRRERTRGKGKKRRGPMSAYMKK